MSQTDPKNNKREEKTKRATDIASRAQRVTKNYARLETAFLKFLRYVSSNVIDRFLFGKKYALFSSLILAIALVFSLSLTDARVLTQYKSVETLDDFKVTTLANTEVYEVVGVPKTVSVQVIGQLADLQMVQSSSNMSVVADLSALSEGTYQIALRAVNYSPKVEIKINPSTVMVTIARKVSKQFYANYEFINTDKADPIYDFGTPIFDNNQVIVRAAQETLDSIATVKALIDVAGAKNTFTTDAKLVAYDQQGNRVDVDIIPNTLPVNVVVTSPSKTVPIVIQPVGEIPNGKSVASVTLDNQSIILYGPNTVLEKITNLTIPVDVSKVTGDTESAVSVVLPGGVRKSNITRVHFTLKLGETTTKTISGIKIFATGLNQSKYRFSLINPNDAYSDVIISGTKENINKVTAEQVKAEVDFSTVTIGKQSLPIVVSGSNPLVRYAPVKAKLDIEVVGV